MDYLKGRRKWKSGKKNKGTDNEKKRKQQLQKESEKKKVLEIEKVA